MFLKDNYVVAGFRVKIFDLPANDFIHYPGGQGAFIEVHSETVKNQIIKKNEELVDAKDFCIVSKTSTLLGSESNLLENKENGIDFRIGYVTPIYQRPYSWSYDQVYKFICDIVDGSITHEPMFAGTIQLSTRKTIESRKEYMPEYEQDIIDGQQRLSTIFLLLKVLSELNPCVLEEYKSLNVSFETRVNNGIEQQKLSSFLDKGTSAQYDNNLYASNGQLIKNLLTNKNVPDEDNNGNVDYYALYKYVTTQLYFVVLETRAGLSKTLKIFNTINTTGLDLNGSDIFKVRFYQYLRDRKSKPEKIFDDISNLYAKVEESRLFDFEFVLKLYQEFLFIKYSLPNIFFDKAASSFFSEYFDCILDGENKNDFFAHKDVELSLDELEQIVNTTIDYRRNLTWNSDIKFDRKMIGCSRYKNFGKIWYQLVLASIANRQIDEESIHKFLNRLNKLTFIYSIRYDKQVNELKTYLKTCYKSVHSKDINAIISEIELIIKRKIEEWQDSFWNELLYNLLDNQKKKDNVCRLVDYLDAKDNNIKDFFIPLFNVPFDIEHIHATNDNSVIVEPRLQNSLGNFALLESSINRSIQDGKFNMKVPQYRKSVFTSIKLVSNHTKWESEEIAERNEKLKRRIFTYLSE